MNQFVELLFILARKKKLRRDEDIKRLSHLIDQGVELINAAIVASAESFNFRLAFRVDDEFVENQTPLIAAASTGNLAVTRWLVDEKKLM